MPDILDPYVGAGGEKQPLDGDEKEAEDVRCERHTYEEDRERLSEEEMRQTIKYVTWMALSGVLTTAKAQQSPKIRSSWTKLPTFRIFPPQKSLKNVKVFLKNVCGSQHQSFYIIVFTNIQTTTGENITFSGVSGCYRSNFNYVLFEILGNSVYYLLLFKPHFIFLSTKAQLPTSLDRFGSGVSTGCPLSRRAR